MEIGSVLFGACALGYAVVALVAVVPRTPGRSNLALALAAVVMAAWAVAVAADPRPSLAGPSAGLDFLRAGAWSVFILVLAGRAHGEGRRWWEGGLLGVLLVGAAVLGAILSWQGWGLGSEPSLASLGIGARLGFAIVLLLLIENLYRNAPEDVRWHINLTCIAVGGVYVYDVVYWSDTVLYRQFSPLLFIGQASINLLVTPLLVLGARRQRRWKDDVGISRAVVFHTATLVLSGIFLVGLAAAGEVFRRFGSEWGTLAEASLLFGGCVAIAVFVTSASARSRLRALVVDHFFTRRFDYQREWMRCIATLSAVGPHLDLEKRVIRAVADVVDSPGGVLFLRDAPATNATPVFRAAGRWNAPALEGDVVRPGHPLLASFRSGEWIAVHEPRASAWFPGFPEAWLAVPLPAAGGPAGFIVLARSRAAFRLDREVFNLLRVVGREVAIFVAEQRATEALVEARQFAEAGQRFAFVAHDIKNVASQLSLLLSNAERHLDDPAFRQDMLATLTASVQRITGLLARLRGPSTDASRRLLALGPRLEAAILSYRGVGSVTVALDATLRDAMAEMDGASFDAVVRHLIDNAIEATPQGGRVSVRLYGDQDSLAIAISDHGRGMGEDFIRDVLFQPFASTKSAGFGLGAFEARTLLREAGGDLVVASTPGHGTTMRICLPRARATMPIALRA